MSEDKIIEDEEIVEAEAKEETVEVVEDEEVEE